MAWTAPRTWTPGEIVTASIMNTHVRDNLVDLDSRMNTAVQLVQETENSLDGNGSLVLAAATSVVVMDFSGANDIEGCSVPVRTPWQLAIVNVNSNVQTLQNEGSDPSAAKRFVLPNNANFAMGLGDGLFFMYITVPLGARWVSLVAA